MTERRVFFARHGKFSQEYFWYNGPRALPPADKNGGKGGGKLKSGTDNKPGTTGGNPARDPVQHNGKTVTQDNSLFDPNAIDEMGRTNTQRMQQGLAPKGYDGKSVNIHHIDQTNNGPVAEMSKTSHTQNYNDLHTNTGQSLSQIDRNEFGKWRND